MAFIRDLELYETGRSCSVGVQVYWMSLRSRALNLDAGMRPFGWDFDAVYRKGHVFRDLAALRSDGFRTAAHQPGGFAASPHRAAVAPAAAL